MVKTQQELELLVREILTTEYEILDITDITIENKKYGDCTVKLTVNGLELNASGTGTVDAIFEAFKNYYVEQYPSLKRIRLINFKVSLVGRCDEVRGSVPGTNAVCEAMMVLKNSYGSTLSYSKTSASLVTAVAGVVSLGVEHLINSERAYNALQRALEDARVRDRHDLINRFTHELSDLVKVTGYDV